MREQGDTQTTAPFYTWLGGSPSACPFLGWRWNQPGWGQGSPLVPQGRAESWAWGLGLAQLLTGYDLGQIPAPL